MEQNTLMQLSTDLKAILKEALPRLVHIGGENVRNRTGFWFDNQYIVSTALSATEGEKVDILAYGNKTITATVLGYDSLVNLVLLKPDAEEKFAAWEGEAPELGALAITAAFPSPAGPEARLELIRCVGEDYFQTDGSAFPGFSGSAVISPSGKLLGIVNVNASGNQGHMLPYQFLATLVKKLSTTGSRKRKVLGVRTQTVKNGLLVVDVITGSAAEKAGLMVGDLLMKVNQRELHDAFSLLKNLEATEGEIDITVKRGEQIQPIKLTPTEVAETRTRLWHHHCR